MRVDHRSGKRPLGHILFFPFYASVICPKIGEKRKEVRTKRDMRVGEELLEKMKNWKEGEGSRE